MIFDISCNFNHKLFKIMLYDWAISTTIPLWIVSSVIKIVGNYFLFVSFLLNCAIIYQSHHRKRNVIVNLACIFGLYLINLWPPENQDLGSSVIKLVCVLFEDTLHTTRQQLPQVCLWCLIDELNKDSVSCLGRSFTHFHWDKLRAFHRKGHSARDVRGDLMGRVSIYTDCSANNFFRFGLYSIFTPLCVHWYKIIVF